MNPLYRWVDRRGRIPWWVRLVYPWAHFCEEMDYLLILGNTQDCFCKICDNK